MRYALLCALLLAELHLLRAADEAETDSCAETGTCPDPSVAAEEEAEVAEYESLRDEMWENMQKGMVKCTNEDERCEDWATSGECKNNPGYMLTHCPKACYICCDDNHEQCAEWADVGECDNNPTYMRAAHGCPWSCNTCQMLDTSSRCRRTPDLVNGLKNMPIEKMFRRLDPDDPTFVFPQFKPEVLSKDPWVVYLHEFITPEHADGLVQALEESGHSFAESSELDLPEGEGAVTKRRTSESMFCDNLACQQDPRILKAHALAQNITGFDLGNMEYIQVVRYDTDQYYVKHQDTSETYASAANGNRIYTLFVYLTDVEEGKGGHTSFPDIDPVNLPDGLKVRPKKGAAALWVNVLKDDPDKVDFRTTHEGSPLLERPKKLGANFWMYAYDWRMLANKGCMNVAVRT